MAVEKLAAPEDKSYKQFVDKLRERTKGITCEDCPHAIWFAPATWGHCTKNVSEFTGQFFQTSKKAPACKQHPRVIELLASSENR